MAAWKRRRRSKQAPPNLRGRRRGARDASQWAILRHHDIVAPIETSSIRPRPRIRGQFRPVGGSPPVPGERMGNGPVVVLVVPEPTAPRGTVVVERVVATVVAAAIVVVGMVVPVEEFPTGTVVTVTAGPEKPAGVVVGLVAAVWGREVVVIFGGSVVTFAGIVVVVTREVVVFREVAAVFGGVIVVLGGLDVVGFGGVVVVTLGGPVVVVLG